jgi:DNA-binding transcriptional MerR regulator
LRKFYSIKDLAVESGVSYHMVYYYIRKNLMQEVGIIGEDQRVFDGASLERLQKILALREEGKGITEIQKILAEEE